MPTLLAPQSAAPVSDRIRRERRLARASLPWLPALLLVLGSAVSPPVAAADVLVFGPAEYARTTGAPDTFTSAFPACRTDRPFRLHVDNGPRGLTRVSSATILLNGAEVLAPSDLSQQVAAVDRAVSLRSDNTLAVTVAGTPLGTLAVSVVSPLGCDVALEHPAPGAAVPAGRLLVRGTVYLGGEVGVTVNGMPAFVHGDAFLALVPVDPGVAELVAVATTPDGRTAEARQPVVVTAAPDAAPRLRAIPAGGTPPLTVRFDLSSPGPVAHVALDARGTGTPDAQGPTLDGVTFVYDFPGVYAPTVTVTEPTGAVRTATALVQVHDRAVLDTRLQAQWGSFKDALRQGDVDRALAGIHGDARARYETMLHQLPAAALADVDRSLTAIRLVDVGLAGAQYEMLRPRDGQTLSFAVWFLLDVDGLWRLRRF